MSITFGKTAENVRIPFAYGNPDVPVPDGPEPTIDEIRGLRVSPEYFVAWNLNAAQGSLFTEDEMEKNARVIVLGSNLGATLFEDGQALGRELLLFRNLYTIVGIMEPAGTDIDDAGIIPAQTPNIDRIPQFARQFVGLNTTLHFTVYDPMRLEEARSQLNLWFSQAYGEGRVVISIPRAEVEAAQDRTSRLVSVILFLAIAGLLIASVNVSNILLGRAMRKRKNVGILKALGASIRDVFGLFFIEALILGASGAVLGTGVSVLISKLMVVAISGGAVLSIMLFLGILAAWAVTTSLTVIPALQAAGAEIRAFDPEGMKEAKELLSGVTWCQDAYEAMEGADALTVLTEWNEFRALDTGRMKKNLNAPVIVDLRNIYNPAEMKDAGFSYSCIGRPDSAFI